MNKLIRHMWHQQHFCFGNCEIKTLLGPCNKIQTLFKSQEDVQEHECIAFSMALYNVTGPELRVTFWINRRK